MEDIFHISISLPSEPPGKPHISVCVCVCVSVLVALSHVRLFATPWTVARQAPLSMGFSRQEYWSGSPFPSPGIEALSPAWQGDSLPCHSRSELKVYPVLPSAACT